MKPDIKARVFVALVVSILAFGVGSGAGIFAGFPGNHSLSDLNLTKTGEFPVIFNQPKNTSPTQTIQPSTSVQSTEQVYQEPASQTPSTSSGNSSNTNNNNQNNNKPNSTN